MIVKADATIQYQKVVDVLDLMGRPGDHAAWSRDAANRRSKRERRA